MSNRRITKEQFVNDGTIDGSRIQKALDETEEYINNIPLEAIKQRYSLNYMVFTSIGADSDASGGLNIGYSRKSPYLAAYPVKRVKGTAQASATLSPYNDTTAYVMTAATSFPRPVILDTVSVFINSLGAAGAGPGASHSFDMSAGGEAYQRVRIIIDTDDTVSSEDRTLNSKEYVLQDFQETFWATKYNNAASQMLPVAAEGLNDWGANSDAMLLRKDGLNIPVHQFARTRFRLVFYQSGAVADPLGTRTPENVTFTVVYKEALRDG